MTGYCAMQALKPVNIMPVILTCQTAFALTGPLNEGGAEEISEDTLA
jgi:hypothetical protein